MRLPSTCPILVLLVIRINRELGTWSFVLYSNVMFICQAGYTLLCTVLRLSHTVCIRQTSHAWLDALASNRKWSLILKTVIVKQMIGCEALIFLCEALIWPEVRGIDYLVRGTDFWVRGIDGARHWLFGARHWLFGARHWLFGAWCGWSIGGV